MSGGLRQTQQLGTDSKPGPLGGFGVYLNADARIFHSELNDAAVFREILGIADGEYTAVPECFEDAVHALALGSGNKENLARSRLLAARDQVNRNGPVGHRFSANRVVERRAERIFAQHANGERIVGIGERLGRPFDESGKVEEKHGFELIFADGGSVRAGSRRGRHEHQRHEYRNDRGLRPCMETHVVRSPGCDWNLHAIQPYWLRWAISSTKNERPG